MLQLDKQIILSGVDGVTIYCDDQSDTTFYMLADGPRFRIENGVPTFRFLEYREPIARQDGKKGGGYVFFDATFDVPDATKTAAIDALQQQVNKKRADAHLQPLTITIGNIPWTKGTAKMLLEAADGSMIQKVWSPGKPSLFGRNIATFAMELSPEGATLFAQALQGKGGVVSVVYDLFTFVKLPPVVINGHFLAEKFYSFSQTIDVQWNTWSEDEYHETIREQFRDSSSYSLDFDWGGMTDPKTQDQIRDWATRTMEDTIEKKMIDAIVPVSADDKKRPDGIDKVTKDISTNKIASFDLHYKESETMDWNPSPQGILPNITNLTGPDGHPLQWKDFASNVDLDDPFFKQLNVTMMVNADFTTLPIHSVNLHIEYPGGDPKDFSIAKAEDRATYNAFIVNNNWKYKYSYEVNYKGSSKTFKSPLTETDENILTVNLDDLGFLRIDVKAGDINFDQVSKAVVTMKYEDGASGVALFEDEFTIDKDHQDHSFEKLLLVAVKNPYSYQVKYFMKEGKEYSVKETEGNSKTLFINDPFSDFKDILIRAIGDLENTVDSILLDLKYVEEVNNYQQSKQLELNKGNTFADWNIPVIDGREGKVSYSGTILFKGGTTEEIPLQTTDKNLILAGPVTKTISVQVLGDLIDFAKVKLVKATMHYSDPENNIDNTNDFIFKTGAAQPATWSVNIKDSQKTKYTWKASFFLVDGTSKTTAEVTTDEKSIVLELPA